MWATDCQFDETSDGGPVKILNVTDEFTREALATNAARRITVAGTIAVLDQICELRGVPQFLRIDNDQSSLATLCATGVKNNTYNPSIATRVHRCTNVSKMVGTSHSTRDSETSCSPFQCLIRCGKSLLCSKNTPTTANHTVPSHTSPESRTLLNGGRKNSGSGS